MGNGIRQELFLDEQQRITSVELDPSARTESNTFVFRSNLLAYFKANSVVQRYFLLELKKRFYVVNKKRKNSYIRYYSQWQENDNTGGKLYSFSERK